MVRVSPRPFRDLFETQFPHKMHFFHPTWTLKQPQILFMFEVKYVDSIMMLVRLDLNPIVSLFQRKCEVSETVSTTTLTYIQNYHNNKIINIVSVRGNTMCLSQLSLSEVQGSEKNIIAQLVSKWDYSPDDD